MNSLKEYISEKLHINNTTKIEYMYHPKDKFELIKYIKEKIDKEGVGTKEKPLDLNDIDTSKIIDMSDLFNSFDGKLVKLSKNGNFDISNWNVSNVITMHGMFWGSNFNGDISAWDVSKVEDMSSMFFNSNFTGENGDIADWDVSNVENMFNMFFGSKFNRNISKWNTINVKDVFDMFAYCSLENNPPKWYK